MEKLSHSRQNLPREKKSTSNEFAYCGKMCIVIYLLTNYLNPKGFEKAKSEKNIEIGIEIKK